MFAVLLIVEKYVFSKNSALKKKIGMKKIVEAKNNIWTGALKHIYVLFFVIISFVLFNAENLGQAATDIGGMFGVGVKGFVSEETLYYVGSYGMVFVLAIIGSLPLAKNIVTKLSQSEKIGTCVEMIKPIFVVLLLLLSTAYLVDGSFNPFLYFRF